MATFALIGNSIDRLTGVWQIPPTTFNGGDIADFYYHLHHERENALEKEGNFSMREKEWPERSIEGATIRTSYIPVYRIHSKEHFYYRENFILNWEESERKRRMNERYSPFGTEGYYFGLTLKAAQDEMKYYNGGVIDPAKHMYLVIECCFDKILYLCTPAIDAVWKVVGLPPPENLLDMYLKIMDPSTDNPVTNAIGIWARKKGFNGIIYPSARYGQDEWITKKKNEGFKILPAINFVELKTHLHYHVIMMHIMIAINDAIRRFGGLEKCIPVFAESNLVLFDGSHISGKKWGVVYQTFPIGSENEILQQDDYSRQSKSFTSWVSDEKPPWLD